MNDKPIDVEALPSHPGEQSQAIALRDQSGAVGILRPADSLDHIAEAFREYQRVCETILDASDYQTYEGKPRKKKSAWRKLATAFNVSTRVVEKEIERDAARNVLSAFFTVEASAGNRCTNGSGYCEITEKCCATRTGGKCRKAAWKGHFCCENGCDGRKHWSHANHDIIATAETRAKNRAIADLIGCGEVSAEELTDEQPGENAPGHAASPAPPQHTPQAPKPPSTPKPDPAAPRLATEQTRQWMIRELAECGPLAAEFFQKLTDPCPLMPNEGLADLPLWAVPTSREAMAALKTAIAEFGNGGQAGWPYKPARAPEPTKAAGPLAETVAQAAICGNPPTEQSEASTEWFMEIIVPVPRKGQKRADYMKHPDTIGSLFEARHGQDDASQEARQRLWGFVNHYEPKGWTKTNGIQMPPSAGDLKFREALDAFAAWFEKTHPNEKL